MYILPYVEKQIDTNTKLYWFFLSAGGKDLWKTDEEDLSEQSILEEYLQPNGFNGSLTCIKENCFFYKVNSPNFADFFLWSDEGVREECWRPFFLLGSAREDDPWGWMEEAEQIKLGSFSLAWLFKSLSAFKG